MSPVSDNLYSYSPSDLFQVATILITSATLPPSPSDCPKLRLIHFTSAGIDHVVRHPIFTDTDITITTSSGIMAPQIAEWVILTALARSHRFPLLLDWQREKKWGGVRTLGYVRDMVGQRLAILGYGAVGRQGQSSSQTTSIRISLSPHPTEFLPLLFSTYVFCARY